MTTTFGIDVSYCQENMNWALAHARGVRFAFIKYVDAYKGICFLDRYATRNWYNARENGVLVSGYHWLTPQPSAEKQADFFLQYWQQMPGDMPPVLDFEDVRFTNRLTYLSMARIWLERINAATGRRPIVYTSTGFMWNWHDQPKVATFLSEYPLWIAAYNVPQPTVPAPWTRWHFWQYAEAPRGAELGSSAILPNKKPMTIDLDYWNGSWEELLAFCELQTAPEPAPYPAPVRLKGKVNEALTVRQQPNSQAKILRYLKPGEFIPIQNFWAEELWIEIATGRWVCAIQNGQNNVEFQTNQDRLSLKVTAERLPVLAKMRDQQETVGELSQGQLAAVLEVNGKNIWTETAPNEWACLLRQRRYIELIKA